MAHKVDPSLKDYISSVDPERCKPIFRAITVDGKRVAMKLEREYWVVLEQIAELYGLKLADVIRAVSVSDLVRDNISSAVRSLAMTASTLSSISSSMAR